METQSSQTSQTGSNTLWFILVGALVAAGIYYFFVGDGKAPPKEPAATESSAPATAPQPAAEAVPAASTEASPADAVANDAQNTVKQIEEQQRHEESMMEKPTMPETMDDGAPKDASAPQDPPKE